MFDYQAGEKYKLTLIMVAIAGMLAGMFFTVLLMPTPDAAPKRRQPPAWASNPDVTGRAELPTDPQGAPTQAGGAPGPGGAQPIGTDPVQAQTFVANFCRDAWDLSFQSARAAQDRAMSAMTEECKQAYTQNIWTPAIAQQIESSGVQSTFTPSKIEPGQMKSDGSVEVTVVGQQSLGVQGKGKTRNVNVVYLVKQFPDGMKIAGISEAGQTQ